MSAAPALPLQGWDDPDERAVPVPPSHASSVRFPAARGGRPLAPGSAAARPRSDLPGTSLGAASTEPSPPLPSHSARRGEASPEKHSRENPPGSRHRDPRDNKNFGRGLSRGCRGCSGCLLLAQGGSHPWKEALPF